MPPLTPSAIFIGRALLLGLLGRVFLFWFTASDHLCQLPFDGPGSDFFLGGSRGLARGRVNQRLRAALQLPGTLGRDEYEPELAVDVCGLLLHSYPPKLAKIGSTCVCTRSFRQLSARTRVDSSDSRLAAPALGSCRRRRSARTIAFKRAAEISSWSLIKI